MPGTALAREDDIMADLKVIDTKLGPLRPELSKLTLDEKGAYYNERYDSGNAAALDCGLCAISIEVHFTSFDETGREVFNKYGSASTWWSNLQTLLYLFTIRFIYRFTSSKTRSAIYPKVLV